MELSKIANKLCIFIDEEFDEDIEEYVNLNKVFTNNLTIREIHDTSLFKPLNNIFNIFYSIQILDIEFCNFENK